MHLRSELCEGCQTITMKQEGVESSWIEAIQWTCPELMSRVSWVDELAHIWRRAAIGLISIYVLGTSYRLKLPGNLDNFQSIPFLDVHCGPVVFTKSSNLSHIPRIDVEIISDRVRMQLQKLTGITAIKKDRNLHRILSTMTITRWQTGAGPVSLPQHSRGA